jgi:Oxidoreductase molybdopterin binding domain/Pentapeptide repeats (8 copies)
MTDQPPRQPLPPRQQLVAEGKWPLVGERGPRRSEEPWSVAIGGAVARPRQFALTELRSLPSVEQTMDIHCVTRWSKLGVRFRGAPLEELLAPAQPLADARFVSFAARSERGHSTSLPLADAVSLGTLVVWEAEGRPLEEIHGGPVRVVVPGRYFYKSLKWLERIELLPTDRLGYWEAEAGYHNGADPWLEQRYMAPSLTGPQMRDALAGRDFAGRDLRSIDARWYDLSGVDARGALLRDADFRGCRLQRACFDGANLSNVHFDDADLREASLAGADLEGASFVGADLRGANMSGASLFGASFCAEEAAVAPEELSAGGTAAPRAAVLDATTRIESAALAQLTPRQLAFVASAILVG